MTANYLGHLSKESERLHLEAQAIRERYARLDRDDPERALLEARYRAIDCELSTLAHHDANYSDEPSPGATSREGEEQRRKLRLDDLPSHVYMLGEGLTGSRASFEAINDARGKVCILAWESAEAREEWIRGTGKDYCTFDIDRRSFLWGAMQSGELSFLLLNLPPGMPFNQEGGFVADDLPPACVYDVKNPESIEEWLCDFWRSQNWEEQLISALRDFYRMNATLTPLELMRAFEDHVAHQTASVNTPICDLKRQGSFEAAWLIFEALLRKQGSSEDTIQMIGWLADSYTHLPLVKLGELLSELLAAPIGSLKVQGDLEVFLRRMEAQHREGGWNSELVEFSRRFISSQDKMTISEAVAAARTLLDEMASLSPEHQRAIVTCFPWDPCSSCGEEQWAYESLAPSGKAAKWRCAYCGRRLIVRADVEAMRRSSGNRQPIPKDVQLAVWQRDQGKCVECGSKEKLEYDHMIPLAEGGANTVRNIQLLCEACNRRKGSKAPGDY